MRGGSRLRELQYADDELTQFCRDLPESACREQPRSVGLHVVSLSLTKAGEGLADVKVVLAWLLDAIGAPTWTIGLLVPIRESLAMLPQLLISARIRRLRRLTRGNARFSRERRSGRSHSRGARRRDGARTHPHARTGDEADLSRHGPHGQRRRARARAHDDAGGRRLIEALAGAAAIAAAHRPC